MNKILTCILILAVIPGILPGQAGDPTGDPSAVTTTVFHDIDPLATLSGDWYPIQRGAHTAKRTNHSLASIQFKVTNTSTVGVAWNTTFIQFLYFTAGSFSWRIKGDATSDAWNHGAQILSQNILRSDLDPLLEYEIEILTTSTPFPAGSVVNSNQIERFRDDIGLQGAFMECEGIIADTTTSFLSVVPEHPILECIVYGDSLADGLVPISGSNNTLHPKGAMASWPIKALSFACANLEIPRTPRMLNHSFSGWWGCQIEFPFQGFNNLRLLRQAYPWSAPYLSEIVDRSHPTAPRFPPSHFELVIYQLAQNDMGTGRLNNPLAYLFDIIGNVTLLRQTWPTAKIIVCSTHVDLHAGAWQRLLMHVAMLAMGYKSDPDLHFVDTGALLQEAGLFPQPQHPAEFIHDFWGMTIGEEIRQLLETR